MKVDIGIDKGHRQNIAQGLSVLLADSYTLYLKTHNFHWNVTGPQFQTLHLMKLATIKEEKSVPSTDDMVKQLVKGHEAVVKTARGILPHAERAHDEATADLLVNRMQVHEKTAWMLRSLQKQEMEVCKL